MKTQTAFVWANCAVEFNAVTAIHLNISVIVEPRNTEDDRALWLYNAVKDFRCLIFRIGLNERNYRLGNFLNSLQEFRFVAIFSANAVHESFDFCVILI